MRLHGDVTPKKEGSKVTDVDQEAVDQIWRLVAAMKEQGIYTIISPYWGSSTKWQASWGVPDPTTGNCSGLVFFDKTLQTGYKAWLKAIYDPVNPYTKMRLADDPAVAIIQLQNEDSMLFGTMQQRQGRRPCASWSAVRRLAQGQVRLARQGPRGVEGATSQADDDLANGVAGMDIVWYFTRDAAAAGRRPAPAWTGASPTSSSSSPAPCTTSTR